MNRFVMTTILLVALSMPTLAGQIPSDGVTSPAPLPPDGATSTGVLGQIPSDGIAGNLSNDMLSAVLAALSLLS